MKKPRRLTRDEKRIIRTCACKSAGFGAVEICPSTKYNLTDASKPESMNIWLVANDQGDYQDTDLADNSFSWKETKVEFAPNGRCAIDFYVYGPLGPDKELQTNVTAFWENGVLDHVDGTCNGTMWRRS